MLKVFVAPFPAVVKAEREAMTYECERKEVSKELNNNNLEKYYFTFVV